MSQVHHSNWLILHKLTFLLLLLPKTTNRNLIPWQKWRKNTWFLPCIHPQNSVFPRRNLFVKTRLLNFRGRRWKRKVRRILRRTRAKRHFGKKKKWKFVKWSSLRRNGKLTPPLILEGGKSGAFMKACIRSILKKQTNIGNEEVLKKKNV